METENVLQSAMVARDLSRVFAQRRTSVSVSSSGVGSCGRCGAPATTMIDGMWRCPECLAALRQQLQTPAIVDEEPDTYKPSALRCQTAYAIGRGWQTDRGVWVLPGLGYDAGPYPRLGMALEYVPTKPNMVVVELNAGRTPDRILYAWDEELLQWSKVKENR